MEKCKRSHGTVNCNWGSEVHSASVPANGAFRSYGWGSEKWQMGQQLVVAGASGLGCWAKSFGHCMARRVSAARIFRVTYGPSARSGFLLLRAVARMRGAQWTLNIFAPRR